MACANLKSFSLTHIQYIPGDPLGTTMALLSLTPVALLVSFMTLILVNKDMRALYFFIGQLINEAFNSVLKKSIKGPRPTYDGSPSLNDGSYGMPSSHSQFIWFFIVYSIGLLLKSRITGKVVKIFGSVALIGLGVGVCISRVYLVYHTEEQVIAGAMVGSLAGMTWFALGRIAIPATKNTKKKNN